MLTTSFKKLFKGLKKKSSVTTQLQIRLFDMRCHVLHQHHIKYNGNCTKCDWMIKDTYKKQGMKTLPMSAHNTGRPSAYWPLPQSWPLYSECLFQPLVIMVIKKKKLPEKQSVSWHWFTAVTVHKHPHKPSHKSNRESKSVPCHVARTFNNHINK